MSESINEFLVRYEKAFRTQNWDEVKGFFHDECTMIFSDGTYKGINEVEKVIKKIFSLIKKQTYEVKDLYWTFNTDKMASCVYTFSWSGEVFGAKAVGAGRGTNLFVKENGQWKIVNEHLGPLPR